LCTRYCRLQRYSGVSTAAGRPRIRTEPFVLGLRHSLHCTCTAQGAAMRRSPLRVRRSPAVVEWIGYSLYHCVSSPLKSDRTSPTIPPTTEALSIRCG